MAVARRLLIPNASDERTIWKLCGGFQKRLGKNESKPVKSGNK